MNGLYVPSRQRGVTLLELLVTIAVLGILLGIAVPQFYTWTQSAKVRSVAESLQNDLRLAQGEAMRRNRQVVFSLINAPGSSSPSIYTPSATPGSFTATTPGTNWMAYVVGAFTGDAEVATTQSQYIAGGDNGNLESPVQVAGALGSASGTANSSITFTPFGRVSGISQNQVYSITRPNSNAHTLQVTVTPAGQVRLCDPSRSITTSPDGC